MGKKKKKPKKGKKDSGKSGNAFRDFFEFSEALGKIPPHRVLAINRGDRAKALRVKIEADQQALYNTIEEIDRCLDALSVIVRMP